MSPTIAVREFGARMRSSAARKISGEGFENSASAAEVDPSIRSPTPSVSMCASTSSGSDELARTRRTPREPLHKSEGVSLRAPPRANA
ncbi:MAG TPA: hypothetical protein VMS56_02980, partial [Thermoanaerobaculia bacterium]|nr:hypothetical protein [Thermoanaerobaculia bacterium]